jgi:hypothetical protein
MRCNELSGFNSDISTFLNVAVQAAKTATWEQVDMGEGVAFQGTAGALRMMVVKFQANDGEFHYDGTVSQGGTVMRAPEAFAQRIFKEAAERIKSINGGLGGLRRRSLSIRRRGFFPTVDNTILKTWFERDRAHVGIETVDGRTVLEFWDDAVREAAEDGFIVLGKGDAALHQSLVDYANHIGVK